MNLVEFWWVGVWASWNKDPDLMALSQQFSARHLRIVLCGPKIRSELVPTCDALCNGSCCCVSYWSETVLLCFRVHSGKACGLPPTQHPVVNGPLRPGSE